MAGYNTAMLSSEIEEARERLNRVPKLSFEDRIANGVRAKLPAAMQAASRAEAQRTRAARDLEEARRAADAAYEAMGAEMETAYLQLRSE